MASTDRGLGAAFAQAGSSSDDGEPGFSTLFAPVDPYNRWPLLNPLISVVGAGVVVLATGVAAASLVVMTLALVLVAFLLGEVFGYEVAMPRMPL